MESKYLFHQSWPDGVLTIPRIDEIISFLELQNFLSNLIFILLKLLWCILFLVWEITGLRSVETRLISSRVETELISSLLIYLVFFFFSEKQKQKTLSCLLMAYFPPWWRACFMQRRKFFIFCWAHLWPRLLLPLLFIEYLLFAHSSILDLRILRWLRW